MKTELVKKFIRHGHWSTVKIIIDSHPFQRQMLHRGRQLLKDNQGGVVGHGSPCWHNRCTTVHGADCKGDRWSNEITSVGSTNVSITVPFRFRVCLKHVNPGRFQECPAGGMARFPSTADEARTRLKKYLEKPISHQFH